METAIQEQHQHVRQVFNMMKIVFVILPIAAGADKFFNILTDWTHYINPILLDFLPFSGETFMMLVGIIEIIAGLIVLFKPRVGGIIVASWLTGIALTLIAGWMYVDVAVRDLVMAVSALAMTKLAKLV
ncbi:MAG TPA: hypothetical protein VFF21_04350 [Flavobacteriaceae bacterium]|nr:hypothetical protein [Flavobacteriaceae bacterium]